MAILKLKADSGTVYLNSDHIERWEARLDRSEVTMASGSRYVVDVTADELAAAIDPENDYERLEEALRQIIWQADATEPLSVKAAQIAQKALDG